MRPSQMENTKENKMFDNTYHHHWAVYYSCYVLTNPETNLKMYTENRSTIENHLRIFHQMRQSNKRHSFEMLHCKCQRKHRFLSIGLFLHNNHNNIIY